jgi:hypothetical protein
MFPLRQGIKLKLIFSENVGYYFRGNAEVESDRVLSILIQEKGELPKSEL